MTTTTAAAIMRLAIAIDVTEMVREAEPEIHPAPLPPRGKIDSRLPLSPTTCFKRDEIEAMKASTMTSFDRTNPLFERNTVSFEVVTSSSVNDANTSNASNNTKQHGRFTVRILQGHRQQKNGGGGAMERVIRFEMSDECNIIADSSETHQSTFIATDIHTLTPTPPMIHFPLMTADRGRTQSTMMQTISQKAVHSSGGRKLLHSKEEMNHHIPSRPIELYELEVGESEFENLRRDQALLVDFQDFANSLISLMQFCEMGDISDSMPPQQQQQQQQQQQDQYVFPYVGGRDTQTDNHHTSQHQWGNNDGSWSTPSQARQLGQQGMLPRMTSPYGKLNSAMPHISKYTCRLERESSASSDEGNQWKNVAKSSPSRARFSIVESNQFRELTHLALSLNVGTDKSVRLYLSSRLSQAMAQTRRVQSICEEHQHRSNTAETELISLRKVVHELTQSSEAEKRQLRYQTEEQLQATNSSHSAEINEVKVAKDAEIKVLIERCEKNRLVHENKIRLLEDVNAKINAEKLTSENETERLATKLSFHEATNNALSNELNSLRDKLQHVSEEKSSIEKSLHQLQLQLSSLHYSNDSQEKMISQTESNRISAEQVSADAKRTLSSQHSQMEDLRRKLEEAELETLKYKDLTSRYQTNRLEMKKRLKEKVEILRESSDVLVVKEKESSELKGQVRSLEEKLQRVQSEKDATSRELSDALRQMKEDKTKLENNQQVRRYYLFLHDSVAIFSPELSPPPPTFLHKTGHRVAEQTTVK